MNYFAQPSAGHKVVKGNIAPHLDYGLDDEIDATVRKNQIIDQLKALFNGNADRVYKLHALAITRNAKLINQIASFYDYESSIESSTAFVKRGKTVKPSLKEPKDKTVEIGRAWLISELTEHGIADFNQLSKICGCKKRAHYLVKLVSKYLEKPIIKNKVKAAGGFATVSVQVT